MDIYTPELDGVEATRRILAEFRTCVIVVSAVDGSEMQRLVREAGAAGLIGKPIAGDALIEAISNYCRAYETGSPGAPGA